ncbi:hypothetical protein CR513_54216, partial [Mucuna pruriens]
IFVKGKDLWDHVDNNTPAPNKDKTMLSIPYCWSLICHHVMNPPSLSYLITHLITLVLVSFVVCLMSIFLHENVQSLMHDLLIVLGPPQDNSFAIAPIQELESANLCHSSHIHKNQKWDPPSVKPLGNKFARLVVLGNKQEYELNYDKTFTPLAKMTTMCTILALAASQS